MARRQTTQGKKKKNKGLKKILTKAIQEWELEQKRKLNNII